MFEHHRQAYFPSQTFEHQTDDAFRCPTPSVPHSTRARFQRSLCFRSPCLSRLRGNPSSQWHMDWPCLGTIVKPISLYSRA